MKRKTTASKSEKRRVFLHRNLSKALCNKVKNPAAPFPHLQIPPTPLTGLTASALHLYTSWHTHIYFLFPSQVRLESNVNREYNWVFLPSATHFSVPRIVAVTVFVCGFEAFPLCNALFCHACRCPLSKELLEYYELNATPRYSRYLI